MAKPASHPPPSWVPDDLSLAICLVLTSIIFVAVLIFGASMILPSYPTMKVAALSVSNLSAAASTGATWKAVVLAEWPDGLVINDGSYLFREVEIFIYYNWDPTQPLAVSSAEPSELRSAASTVMKANMTVERPEAEVAEDMDLERRSVGTVIVGLGVRTRLTYRLWWKKSFGHVQARCDGLRMAFANSTTTADGRSGSTVEGSLVIRNDPNLPSCTFS